MANFFNKQQDVMDIQLTQYGKFKYSQGHFDPKYYSFYDTDITYDGEYAGKTEIQNDVITRIKDATRTKPLYKFVGTVGGVFSSHDLGGDQAIEPENMISYGALLGSEQSKAKPEIVGHIYKKPLGNNSLLRNKAPAWHVYPISDSQPISGSIIYQGSGSNYTDNAFGSTIWHDQMIPKLNFMVEYTYNYDADRFEDSQIVDIAEEQRVLLQVEEKNVLNKRLGNFEIEVFLLDKDETITRQLHFVNRSLVTEEGLINLLNETDENLEGSFPKLTERMVEYWLDLRVDDEIIDRSTPPPSEIYHKDIGDSGEVCD